MSEETARALLARIAAEREAFNAEIEERRQRLAERDANHRALMEGIAAAWHRLAIEHQAKRRRFERRFGKRPPMRAMLRDTNPEWRAYLTPDPNHPESSLVNALVCLRECPMLSGLIATDLTTGKMMLKGPLPLDYWENLGEFEMREVRVTDVTAIREFLQMLALPKLTQEDCAAAVKRIARENAWRPGVEDGEA